MGLIVQKFGGTSVADICNIKRVANKVTDEIQKGNQVIVVVSAMSGVTNRLVGYFDDIVEEGDVASLTAEHDLLLASGEQVTASLLSLLLQKKGYKSRAWLGWQVPIHTTNVFGDASIMDIGLEGLQGFLAEGGISVVAGFQGLYQDNVTTLGRGGSDTSAVAIASKMNADRCDIYTDVDGVFTADPRIVKNAFKLHYVSYEEMFELASCGAKILHARSVALAMKSNLVVRVLSTFSDDENGTILSAREEGDVLLNNDYNDYNSMEESLITGIAHERNQVRVTLFDVPNVSGKLANIFDSIAKEKVFVDMIVQNFPRDQGYADVTFTILKKDCAVIESKMVAIQDKVGFSKVSIDHNFAKLTIVGVGMARHSGIACRTFEALGRNGVSVIVVSTSEIKISLLIEDKFLELAVRGLHEEFFDVKDKKNSDDFKS